MIENGEIGIVIVKDMSRLGRNYLQVGMYTDVIFPNNDVRFIAVNDNVDSAVQTEFDMTPIRNFCNELYARDTAKKITSSFRIKGEQGRHLSVNPPFGYVKDEKDKNNWLIDEETAEIVRYIFRLCAEGFGPSQIANRLRKEKVLTPTAYKKPDRMLFENTHPAIIDENIFNIVQEVRSHKHRPTKTGKVSLFSGKVFCADCGAKLYFNTTNKSTENQDSFTCSNYRSNTGTCTAHYIRNVTLYKMVFRHIQNVLSYIQQFESVFVKKEMQKSRAEQEEAVERAKVDIVTLKRRDEDLDILFKRIYEDSVTGRLSAERFDKLAADYETEQKELRKKIGELQYFIDNREHEMYDLKLFLKNVRKYTDPEELTAEMLNDLIDKILVHAPNRSNGQRTQKIEIYYKAVGVIEIPDLDECIAAKMRQNDSKMTA